MMQRSEFTVALRTGPEQRQGYAFTIEREGQKWPLFVWRNTYGRWECADYASGYSVDSVLRTPSNSTRKTVMETAQIILTQDCYWFDIPKCSAELPVLNAMQTEIEVAA